MKNHTTLNILKNSVFQTLVCFVLSINTGFAQKDSSSNNSDYKGFIMFSLGTTSPLGDLADQNMNNPNSGLASTGADVRFSAGYLLSDYVGICAMYHGESFLLDAQSMADQMASAYPGTAYTVAINSGWGIGGMMFGGYGNFPLTKSKKIIAQPKLMIGFALGTSPDFSITASRTTGGVTQTSTAHQLSTPSQAVASFLIGNDFRFNLKKRWCFNIGIDYLGLSAKTKYRDVKINDKNGLVGTTDFDMKMSCINVTFGIGFRFGK